MCVYFSRRCAASLVARDIIGRYCEPAYPSVWCVTQEARFLWDLVRSVRRPWAQRRSHRKGRAMQSWRYVLRSAIPVLLLICVGIVPVPAAAGPPASYHIALLHVTYSDTTAIYTPAQLKAAAGEIHNYYEQISYGQIDLSVTPVEVTLPKKQEFYFDQCLPAPQEKRVPCPPSLIEDAAQAAAAGGFSFTGINGISVLSTFCSGDWTNGSILISRPGVNGTFGRSYDFECSGPAPGSSG